ncbi:hypothetical protein BKA70DRAFT_1573915 [Coprinopsis sp. MPI-PUGE-AT-0042]|nr:hypothetical protein BKA70DRAFT_1573915 [Coprinopsis sp. MPI-PUGE-AT-0042]
MPHSLRFVVSLLPRSTIHGTHWTCDKAESVDPSQFACPTSRFERAVFRGGSADDSETAKRARLFKSPKIYPFDWYLRRFAANTATTTFKRYSSSKANTRSRSSWTIVSQPQRDRLSLNHPCVGRTNSRITHKGVYPPSPQPPSPSSTLTFLALPSVDELCSKPMLAMSVKIVGNYGHGLVLKPDSRFGSRCFKLARAYYLIRDLSQLEP